MSDPLNDLLLGLYIKSVAEAIKEEKEKQERREFVERITNISSKSSLLDGFRKDLDSGKFYGQYNENKTIDFLFELLGDEDDAPLHVQSLNILCSISFQSQSWRVAMIEKNCMLKLCLYVENCNTYDGVNIALMTLQNLLGAGDPGTSVSERMNTTLAKIYWNKLEGTSLPQSKLIRIKLSVAHTISLLAFRIKLNSDCLRAIKDFLSNSFVSSIDDLNISPNDVRNIFKCDVSIVRMMGYWLISKIKLTSDNWSTVASQVKSVAVSDWEDSTFSSLVKTAVKKLEMYCKGLEASIISQRQTNQIPLNPTSYSQPRVDRPYPSVTIKREEITPLDPAERRKRSINKFLEIIKLSREEATKQFNLEKLLDFYEDDVASAINLYYNKEILLKHYPSTIKPTPVTVSKPSPASAPKPTQSSPKPMNESPASTNSSQRSLPTSGSVRISNPVNLSMKKPSLPGGEYKNLMEILNTLKKIDFNTEFKDAIEIGKGSFGVVFSAKYKNDMVAIKKIGVTGTLGSKRDYDTVKGELEVLEKMRHDRTLILRQGFRDDTSVYLVSKYYDRGSLHKVLHEEGVVMGKQQFMVIASDICEGLIYLHNYEPPILHLDLKPHNILVEGKYGLRAVLADFGLSKLKKEVRSSIKVGTVGTFSYMAPEVFTKGSATVKSDIYSYGLILYEMVENKESWSEPKYKNIPHPQAANNGDRPEFTIERNDESLRDLIKRCWETDYNSRPDSAEVQDELLKLVDDESVDW